jgi:hypothetical protein
MNDNNPHSFSRVAHPVTVNGNPHSLHRIANTLAENNRTFLENTHQFNAMVARMHEYRNKQQHRDDILNTLYDSNHILNDDNCISRHLSPPNLNTFCAPTPVFFHIIVEAHHVAGEIGRFSVFAEPKTAKGDTCLMESGQVVVMWPNLTVAWYIEQYEIKEHTVKYTATSDQVQAIRYFEIRHAWSLVASTINSANHSQLFH